MACGAARPQRRDWVFLSKEEGVGLWWSGRQTSPYTGGEHEAGWKVLGWAYWEEGSAGTAVGIWDQSHNVKPGRLDFPFISSGEVLQMCEQGMSG